MASCERQDSKMTLNNSHPCVIPSPGEWPGPVIRLDVTLGNYITGRDEGNLADIIREPNQLTLN